MLVGTQRVFRSTRLYPRNNTMAKRVPFVFLTVLLFGTNNFVIATDVDPSQVLSIISSIEKEKQAFRWTISFTGREWSSDATGNRQFLLETIDNDKYSLEESVLIETMPKGRFRFQSKGVIPFAGFVIKSDSDIRQVGKN